MGGRCVCGRSATFPLCDGSHDSEDWSCAGTPGGTVVRGGRHLASAAARLAHHLGAELHHDGLVPPASVQRLLLLVDASDLPDLPRHVAAVPAERVEVLAIDLPASAIAPTLPRARVREVPCPNPLHLWRQVRAALDDHAPIDHAPRLARGFVSHAVADEPHLLPVVDRLRRHAGAELFVCADSLQPGDRWLDRILAALDEADRFVLVVSAASVASTFCAFEAGWARRAGTPIHSVSLDGTPPPAFVGDVQMIDVVRHRAARPWLSEAEALTEAMVRVLG